MGRSIVFGLGTGGSYLSSRQLIIDRLDTVPVTNVYDQSHAGGTETVEVELAEGYRFQAKLIDTKGEKALAAQLLDFHTGTNMPDRVGPQTKENSLCILAWEDTSSSSSSSSVSSSSSSSTSTSSLSSSSSSSTSSRSSSSSSSVSSSSSSSVSSSSSSS